MNLKNYFLDDSAPYLMSSAVHVWNLQSLVQVQRASLRDSSNAGFSVKDRFVSCLGRNENLWRKSEGPTGHQTEIFSEPAEDLREDQHIQKEWEPYATADKTPLCT